LFRLKNSLNEALQLIRSAILQLTRTTTTFCLSLNNLIQRIFYSMETPTIRAVGWRLAELASRHPDTLIVHITPDLRSYRALAEELPFFLPNRDLLWRFPAWEVLPYDRVSPHHAIVGERFATLSRLLRTPNPHGVLLTALPAWLQRIAPPASVAAHVWQIKVGDQLDLSKLQHQLTELACSLSSG